MKLVGRFADIATHPIEDDTSVTVKAPRSRPGIGTDIITTQPVRVDHTDGTFTIDVAEGLGWIYVEGDGWSDSIPFVAAVGMTQVKEAVMNAAANSLGVGEYLDVKSTFEQMLTDAVKSVPTDVRWDKPPLTGSDDLRVLRAGVYPVQSIMVAKALGLPIEGMASLEVLPANSANPGHRSFVLTGYTGPNDFLVQEMWTGGCDKDGKMGQWVRVYPPVDKSERILSAGQDWDKVLDAGAWSAHVTGRNFTNTPYDNPVGVLHVHKVNNASGQHFIQTFLGISPPQVWIRQRTTRGWHAWEKVYPNGGTGGAGVSGGVASARRAVVVDSGLSRRGKIIGTGGRGAVALRFDHHTEPFQRKVLPLLKKYRLPWSQALNIGSYGTGNDTMPLATLVSEAHKTGGEVWNHGLTHSNVASNADADKEIGTSLGEIRKAIPSMWIDSFAAYGSGDMMGLAGWDTPEKFFSTYPGQLILDQHAFVSGLYPGIVRALGAPQMVGDPYTPMDKMSVSQVRARVNEARDTLGGVTFMLHPNRVDESGYLTSADLDAMLKYIADQRDADRIVVTSTAGRSMASTDHAPTNLLTSMGRAGKVTSTVSETVSSLSAPGYYGVPHEARVWVKATADTTVKLTVEITGTSHSPAATHTVTLAAGEVSRLGVPITPALDTTATKVTLAGNVEHLGVVYGPI